jgi:hypothetical protein
MLFPRYLSKSMERFIVGSKDGVAHNSGGKKMYLCMEGYHL